MKILKMSGPPKLPSVVGVMTEPAVLMAT